MKNYLVSHRVVPTTHGLVALMDPMRQSVEVEQKRSGTNVRRKSGFAAVLAKEQQKCRNG